MERGQSDHFRVEGKELEEASDKRGIDGDGDGESETMGELDPSFHRDDEKEIESK